MGKQLVVITGLERGRVIPLSDADIIQLGCSQNLDILGRFRDPEIARVHCEVQVEGDRVIVIDAETPRGTYVNRKRIAREELRPGDVIRIGTTELKFICEEPRKSDADTILSGELSETQPKPPSKTDVLVQDDILFDEAPALKATPAENKAKATAEQLNLLVGRTFANYKIGPILGTGHWGRVFQARDLRGGNMVALKVLRPEFCDDKGATTSLGAAVRAVLPLRHPNLITHIGAGIGGSFPWIAMELFEGKSLTQVIRRIQNTGMLDWRQTVSVAVQVARALDAVHQNGLRHGNLTPQAVLIRESDRIVKLTGLLLAKALEVAKLQPVGRLNEHVDDTPFMSPERTYGLADADIRSDIYSLGAILYALVTGHPPFEGTSQGETVHRIRTHEPVRPKKYQPLIDEGYEGTLLKMLRKDPAGRPQSPSEFLIQLTEVARCAVRSGNTSAPK
jgi:pSer/pThr/pTyr-binding forkhead associated (FHA) protein